MPLARPRGPMGPMVTTKIMSREGDHPAIRAVVGMIYVGNDRAGNFSAYVVDRDQLEDGEFHTICNEEGQDLGAAACAFFNRNGEPRLKALKGIEEAQEGMFVYVSSFTVEEEHRKGGATDVGSEALHRFLMKDLEGVWSVAAYVPDAGEAMTAKQVEAFEEMAAEMASRAEAAGNPTPESTKDHQKREAQVIELCQRDSRQFLRCGFKPAQELAETSNSIQLYAAVNDVRGPRFSHEEAMAVEFVTLKLSRPPPEGADRQLLELIASAAQDEEVEFAKEARKLVDAGANVNRCSALHCAASYQNEEHLSFLLRLDPRSLNSRDQSNATPLMIAAATAAGNIALCGGPQTGCIRKLIQKGANRGLVDDLGRTALGHIRAGRREYGDMAHSMGIPAREAAKYRLTFSALEALVMPPDGPTEADETLFVPSDSEEEDAEGNRDEDTYLPTHSGDEPRTWVDPDDVE